MGYTSTYYYDSSGILYSVVRSNGSKTAIKYTDNTVTGRTTDQAGHLMSTWMCFLNNRGLVDSLVKRDSTQITTTKKFLYDDKGFATEEREYQPGGAYAITRKTIVNNDIVSYTVMKVAAIPAKISFNTATKKYDTVSITATDKEYTVYCEYMPDKEKTLSFGNYGSPEFGEGAKNIEKRTVQISSEGDTIDVSLFKYLFDEKGRVIQCVTRNQAGELLDSNNISYY
jgi:hypothetical protein